MAKAICPKCGKTTNTAFITSNGCLQTWKDNDWRKGCYEEPSKKKKKSVIKLR